MGDKARARRVMKKAGVPVLPGSDGLGRERREGAQDRQGDRLPGDRQGDRRRRRARHARRGERGRADAGVQDGAARGRGGVRREGRLHREVPRVAAAHRVPDPRRPPRQRRAPRRARVLDPAAPPEADRGVAVARADREAAAEDGRHRRGRGPRRAVHERRHVRVPARRQREVLLHGGEHPPAGRARRHRAGDRHRHRQGADPDRGGRAAVVQAERGHVHRARDRVPHQRRGPGHLRAVARHDPRLRAARRARRARRHGRALGVHDLALLRLDDRQGHRTAATARRRSRACAGRSR